MGFLDQDRESSPSSAKKIKFEDNKEVYCFHPRSLVVFHSECWETWGKGDLASARKKMFRACKLFISGWERRKFSNAHLLTIAYMPANPRINELERSDKIFPNGRTILWRLARWSVLIFNIRTIQILGLHNIVHEFLCNCQIHDVANTWLAWHCPRCCFSGHNIAHEFTARNNIRIWQLQRNLNYSSEIKSVNTSLSLYAMILKPTCKWHYNKR